MSVTEDFLLRCGLFRGFDKSRLGSLSRSVEEIDATLGTDIIREGDPGDAMFVVLRGAVQVYTRNHDGREVVLARLETGEHFGEQALLPGGTGRRNASVRAVDTARIARVPKSAFQAVLAEDDALREHLVEIGDAQIRNNLQQLSPLARGIGLDREDVAPLKLAVGETLFLQGDEADALYFVTSGRLGVWREEGGNRTLIGYVERDGSVGELALIRKNKRGATVIAVEATELIAIPRAVFDDVYRQSEPVRERLTTIQHAYELPQRGIVTQHAGTFSGYDCVTTLYHLRSGGIVAAYRVVGHALYAVERLGAETAETLTWKAESQSRELRLDGAGNITGLTVRGEWPDVNRFHELVLDQGRVGQMERREFLRFGRFDTPRPGIEPGIVCQCVHVTGETLLAAIKQGATTFTALQQATRCGTVCGGCVPVVTEMLGAEEWVQADVVAERDEAPGVRSFELAPRHSSYPDAAPGQHIVVEGIIDGLRVRRPYTLSSPARHNGRLRITVKRENGGAFSPWLFDRRPKGEPLRITRPRGEYRINSDEPAVCLVAGIGVTPALAAAATASQGGRTAPLVVHYSGRERQSMACRQELEAAAGDSSMELIVRETASQGHLERTDVSSMAARFPKANWYLCGPDSYLDGVGRLLKDAHVSGDRIHVEAFTPVGTPAATSEERAAFTRYLLVPPQLPPRRPVMRVLRRFGKSLRAFANSPASDWKLGAIQLNPLRSLENRIGRAARLDPALPLEYMGMVSALSWGPFKYQLRAFERLQCFGSANRARARQALAESKPLPWNTPDGDTFTYWMPAAPFPKFPPVCNVDTGFKGNNGGLVLPIYVTRSRTALDHLLRRGEDTDRGAFPYRYFQQVLGRTDVQCAHGRQTTGLFAGAYHDNITWTEDRALTSDMFGFPAIDHFGPGMAAAADEVCSVLDEVLARNPDKVIDLNVLLSKVAYTIIVRAVFGNVDLAEMHALGRTLSESIRTLLSYLFEFVMGRQSVPPDYVEAFKASRLTGQKIIDLIRELDRSGKLSEVQRSAPVIRLVVDSAGTPEGAYERLGTFVLPLIIAGHETTGHAMSWAFYEITRNAELEKALLAEIETFRAAHNGRPLSTEDYDERPLSWALLAECLRRHCPLQSVARTTLKDGVVPADPETGIGGFEYPAGAMIVCSILGIHLDPDRWPDPLAFRPERWFEGISQEADLVEKGRGVRANIRAREQVFDLLAFSDGPPRCPGQHFNAHEFLLILDALLPRYRFEVSDPGEIAHSDNLVVGPEPGRMGVRIRPRPRRTSAPLQERPVTS